MLILPSLAEQISYAVARGRVNAETDAAQRQLEDPHAPNLSDYAKVAKLLNPSVTGVKASHNVSGPPDEMSFLFGGRSRMREQDQGSGVIVDEAGYVITNYHVVDRSTDVSVELADGSHHRATVMGADPATDIAVLKIDSPHLRAAHWGDSDRVEVGDPVLAIGNPYGLARTVTAGIISAKGRHAVIEDVNYQDFLQTDAAVNPGNSGGPLVNLKGEVVGINTAILGQAYQGIGFAIPSNLARGVYEQLRKSGRVARGWLGVASQEVTAEMAEKLGLKTASGALVNNVLADTPAAEAGIEVGDVITRWNQQPIENPAQLALSVASTPIGSKVQVLVIRNGAEVKLSVTVAERPADDPPAPAKTEGEPRDISGRPHPRAPTRRVGRSRRERGT
ncbi:MAG: trypsin-like peptidase domain-containing protein [Thermoguttaceae bacterium]